MASKESPQKNKRSGDDAAAMARVVRVAATQMAISRDPEANLVRVARRAGARRIASAQNVV